MEMLTVNDVARKLGRSKRTVQWWCREKRLTAHTFAGSYCIYDFDLKTFQEKNPDALRENATNCGKM